MGACNGANYLSRQPERNRIVNTRYVDDPRFISFRRLFTQGELFGMDFIFQTIPRRLVPFDWETMMASKRRFIVAATDCETGEAVYFEKEALGEDFLKVLQASCSLPLLQKPVDYAGRSLMDGGIADSIPLRKSFEDGNRRHVLILTRPKGYRKKPSAAAAALVRWRYPRRPGLAAGFAERHIRYNAVAETIDALERKGEVFVIRPEENLPVGRLERNREKLYAVYDQGYEDAMARRREIGAYLEIDFDESATTAFTSGF
jgi:predicted patatin/cPLA2 family phospholipase